MASDLKPDDEREPPTERVLSLLQKTFAFWQNSWYFDRIPADIKDLKGVIEALYQGQEREQKL
jgi:hypothetical protein